MFVNAANKDVAVGSFKVPAAGVNGTRKTAWGRNGFLGTTLLASSLNWVLRTMRCKSTYIYTLGTNVYLLGANMVIRCTFWKGTTPETAFVPFFWECRLWISILAMTMGLKYLLSSPQASVTSLAWSCTYQPMRGIPQRVTPRRTATRMAGVSTLVLCPLSWLKWWACWPCTCSSTGTGSCGRARGPQITCRARLSRASPATGTATGAAPAPHPAPQTPRTPATPRRWAWRVSGLCPPPRSPCTHSPAGATP